MTYIHSFKPLEEKPTLYDINEIAKEAMRSRVDSLEQAYYAFVAKQFEHIISIGEDPRKYELVLDSINNIDYDNDGYRINSRLRLRKIEEADANS